MTDYAWILSKKYPGKQWSMDGGLYEGIVWHDGQPISKETLDQDYLDYKASTDYIRKRANEYPSLDELVVALWESVVEGRSQAMNDLESKRQAIKAKYPKPSAS